MLRPAPSHFYRLCLRLAWLSLQRDPVLNVMRLLCLFLALLGPYGILLVRDSFQRTLSEQGKLQLGADLVISFDTAPEDSLLQALKQKIPAESQYKWGLNLVSMAESKSGASHLVEILALDEGLPYYRDSHSSALLPSLLNRADAIIDSEGQVLFDGQTSLLLGNGQLDVRPGELQQVAMQFRFTGLGPRLVTTVERVKALGLTEFGAQNQHLLFIKLPETHAHFDVVAPLREELKKSVDKLTPDGASVYSFERPSGRTQRAIDRTLSYLGLVALLSFLMGLVGGLYLTWSYWLRAQDQLALFKAIAPRGPQWIVIFQIVILGTIACLLAMLTYMIATSALGLAGEHLTKALSFQLQLTPSLTSVLWLLGLGVVVPLLACLPLIQMAAHVPIATLLEDRATSGVSQHLRWPYLLMPPALFLGTYLFTNSWIVAGLFVTIIAAVLMLGPGLCALVLRALHWLPGIERAPLAWQLAWRSMLRRPMLSGLMVVSMSMSFGVFHAVEQLQRAIERDLLGGQGPSAGARPPSFFLMDMPASAKDALEQIIRTHGGKLLDLSHHLRGRLMTINGREFSESGFIFNRQSQEAQDRQRLQRHQLGLTFRSHLAEDEIIMEGSALSELPAGEIGASIEKRYAKRMGIKLGDVLEFDIFGTIIRAKAVNFRQVRWLNFRPNFFVVLSPQGLGNLPFTYLGAIDLQRDDTSTKQHFLQELRRQIPGVSAIDVQRGLQQVSKLVTVIGGLLRTCAWLLPIGACLMLLGLAIYQRQEKKIDQHTLFLLGVSKTVRRHINLAEYAFIGPLSTAMAYLLGTGLLLAMLMLLVDLPLNPWQWGPTLSAIIPYTLGLGFIL